MNQPSLKIQRLSCLWHLFASAHYKAGSVASVEGAVSMTRPVLQKRGQLAALSEAGARQPRRGTKNLSEAEKRTPTSIHARAILLLRRRRRRCRLDSVCVISVKCADLF